ncbi:MAG: Xaa-Pro peptidase family protein [Gammaproteobacteria bacterium]|nr:Xaa-Pro peptidase family protein [Gammaproteobacteria bacterium]
MPLKRTVGVGGSNSKTELMKLSNMSSDIKPISVDEYRLRIEKACNLMQEHKIAAIYLNVGTNLLYFTGTKWGASERMVGALLTSNGELQYIAPNFEISTLNGYVVINGNINGWEEHENPYEVFNDVLIRLNIESSVIGIDESCPFFISEGIREASPQASYVNAKPITAGCRMRKSSAEIQLMQRAKDITLEVHKAAARILTVGITTTEVSEFIHKAHIKLGAPKGSYFCIVLFGEDTAYPHGVSNPKALEENDMVLIDTGCQLHGYNSDITRSYVFGVPSERDKEVWDQEKMSQAIGFNAAKLGAPCGSVDDAARGYLISQGYGPGYQTPGLAHRTGHGIGLDIHEWPYLVSSDNTPLDVGMCFSNEPMISIPGEFGIRLEDHFYMTNHGPKWFTTPSHSIEDPFGYEA